MGKIYRLLFLLLLSFLASCGDDDDAPSPVDINAPDTEKPTIQFLSPEENTTYLIIDLVSFSARASDNKALEEVRAFLISADGNKREVTEPYTLTEPMRFLTFGISFYPRDTAPGTYTLVLEVKDKAQNLAKDSLTLTMHAPDLNKTEFARAFQKSSFFSFLDWGWFGFDFTNGIDFNESQFDDGMFMLMSLGSSIPKDQWEKFVKDFRFEKQTWTTWDEDRDDVLSIEEFRSGLDRLDLFDEWDLNDDGLVKEAEFVAGIFNSWDRNRNQLLSREEYFDTFYTYLAPWRDR